MDEMEDPACILCAIDRTAREADGKPAELAATYYAVGLASGYRPERCPGLCDRHMAMITKGALFLGMVCNAPPSELEEYERKARELARYRTRDGLQ